MPDAQGSLLLGTTSKDVISAPSAAACVVMHDVVSEGDGIGQVKHAVSLRTITYVALCHTRSAQ